MQNRYALVQYFGTSGSQFEFREKANILIKQSFKKCASLPQHVGYLSQVESCKHRIQGWS